MAARVLIAGCGYVGTQLGRLLARNGHRVWGLRRGDGALPRGIRPLRADLLQPSSLDNLPRELDFVFYLAAAKRRDRDSYAASYVRGLGNLLQALSRHGQRPQRVFFSSSTGVYAQRAGQWVDEDSAVRQDRDPTQQLVVAERQLAMSGFPSTVVRFSGIYGPGRRRLLELVRSGRARQKPGPPRWTNRIHRDDCAAALMHLMQLERPDPLYLASDDEPADYNHVVSWLAQRLGHPQPPYEAAEEDTARSRGQGKRCSNARLRATGFRLRYPTFREGYLGTAEAGRQLLCQTPDWSKAAV